MYPRPPLHYDDRHRSCIWHDCTKGDHFDLRMIAMIMIISETTFDMNAPRVIITLRMISMMTITWHDRSKGADPRLRNVCHKRRTVVSGAQHSSFPQCVTLAEPKIHGPHCWGRYIQHTWSKLYIKYQIDSWYFLVLAHLEETRHINRVKTIAGSSTVAFDGIIKTT